MSQLLDVHGRLNTIDWNSLFEYSEDSPTFLNWKNEYRVGNKGTPTKRKTLTVGGINSEGFLVVTIDKKPYSIPKIER